MRNHRADKYQRRHPQRNHFCRAMNLFKNQVVTRFNVAAKTQIDPAHGKTGKRQ